LLLLLLVTEPARCRVGEFFWAREEVVETGSFFGLASLFVFVGCLGGVNEPSQFADLTVYF
jgi:hypothetical protein